MKPVLQELLRQLQATKDKPDAAALKTWWKQIDQWRGRECLKYAQNGKIIKPQFVIEKLHELTKGDAFITSDVGQHQMWAAQFYKFGRTRDHGFRPAVRDGGATWQSQSDGRVHNG